MNRIIRIVKLFTAVLALAGTVLFTGCNGAADEFIGGFTEEYSEVWDASQSLDTSNSQATEYKFRTSKLLNQHFEKHGKDMGFVNAKDYEKAASDVINNPQSLNKIEAEDGDYVYYLEATNEFVILSVDGYIRTYFYPDSGKKYYDRQ